MAIQEIHSSTTHPPVSSLDRGPNQVEGHGSSPRKPGAREVTPALRYALIAERAYIKGCQRGFINGSTDEDWSRATEEIDAQIRTRRT